MKSQILRIELHSENFPVLEFKNHFSAREVGPYQALAAFEGANWKLLGECFYKVFLQWEDGGQTEEVFKGNNADANLAEFVEYLTFVKA